MPYRRPGGGGGAPAQAFAADTSGAPVTITLPALDGLEDGYIVRVYDSGSNAATNNITINDADAAELDVIDEDDGERWLVVVGGAWEVRGYLPGPSSPAVYASFKALALDASNDHIWAFETAGEDTGSVGSLPLTFTGVSRAVTSLAGCLGQINPTPDYNKAATSSVALGTDRSYRMEVVGEVKDNAAASGVKQLFGLDTYNDVRAGLWVNSGLTIANGSMLLVHRGTTAYDNLTRAVAGQFYASAGYDQASQSWIYVLAFRGGPTYRLTRYQASGAANTGPVALGTGDGTFFSADWIAGYASLVRGEGAPSDAYLESALALLNS